MKRAVVALAVIGSFLGALAGGVLVADPIAPRPSNEFVRPLTPPADERGDWTAAQVRDFRGFAVYWVGEEFRGTPLTRIIRHASPNAGVPEDVVLFIYGTCVPLDTGCKEPLAIRTEPYCYKQPSNIADEVKDGEVFKVRGGGDAQVVAGSLRIWTGDVSIQIYGTSDELRTSAVDALVAANGLGPTVTSDALAAPNSDCSNFTTLQ